MPIDIVIVMGVSGSGKSTVAVELASVFNAAFIDGDDLHPEDNKQKMAKGQPLNDTDRMPWLQAIKQRAFEYVGKGEKVVVVCSALKQSYRDLLRDKKYNTRFIYLKGSYDLIYQRLLQRQGHFMKADMLQSQFDTLKEPDGSENDVLTVDIHPPVLEIITTICHSLEL
ncbi:gluconokinase [Carboxylicivirga marina]|uniref:gluconokinase n=1 Tax=Carboxylicivirga marina TaxID=2800988 RepID=UPI002598124A|nr:gluconokinase [uncultured Carboxylicivirga sp.]